MLDISEILRAGATLLSVFPRLLSGFPVFCLLSWKLEPEKLLPVSLAVAQSHLLRFLFSELLLLGAGSYFLVISGLLGSQECQNGILSPLPSRLQQLLILCLYRITLHLLWPGGVEYPFSFVEGVVCGLLLLLLKFSVFL